MKAGLTRDDIDTLRSELRTLRDDLKDIGNEVSHLATRAARTWTRPAPRGLMHRIAHGGLLRRDTGDPWSDLRARGAHSVDTVRTTIQDYPLAVVLGAFALGWVIAAAMRSRSARE
ncbi:MAG TPA: hypothetical protein VF342_05975 [Alphaproteobacteria bacterium]